LGRSWVLARHRALSKPPGAHASGAGRTGRVKAGFAFPEVVREDKVELQLPKSGADRVACE